MSLIVHGGGTRQVSQPTDLPDAPGRLRGTVRRRPPGWVVRLAGLSLGGLVTGIAIGLRLPT